MSFFTPISVTFARFSPVRFFAVGAVLFLVGVLLQTTQFVDFPAVPFLGETPFGVFSKLGGIVVLLGLLIVALRSDGSDEPNLHIPEEVPRSARRTSDTGYS